MSQRNSQQPGSITLSILKGWQIQTANLPPYQPPAKEKENWTLIEAINTPQGWQAVMNLLESGRDFDAVARELNRITQNICSQTNDQVPAPIKANALRRTVRDETRRRYAEALQILRQAGNNADKARARAEKEAMKEMLQRHKWTVKPHKRKAKSVTNPTTDLAADGQRPTPGSQQGEAGDKPAVAGGTDVRDDPAQAKPESPCQPGVPSSTKVLGGKFKAATIQALQAAGCELAGETVMMPDAANDEELKLWKVGAGCLEAGQMKYQTASRQYFLRANAFELRDKLKSLGFTFDNKLKSWGHTNFLIAVRGAIMLQREKRTKG